ncbi:MAG: hypothetical protein KC635_12000 [Myxococcales bacterium]|nr:hypothetical protein [Myxococcales bacterium]MCB9731333.1 hypothetical protein [Deltaproteobacteria bacterium]
MFAGRYDHALDEKGRTMTPKRFRKRLVELGDQSVWITNALDGRDHFEVRPDSSFHAFADKLTDLGNTKRLQDLRRYYVGAAVEIEIDAAGRLLIPAQFRAQLGLTDKIAFLGVDRERFEIWHPDVLDQRFAAVADDSDDFLDLLSEKGV